MDVRYGAPVAGDEKAVLSGFLDQYRAVLLEICTGVSDGDLRRPMTPTGTTLLGMVKHLAYVEAWWFRENLLDETPDYPWTDDDMDADFRIEPHESTEDIFELYRAACERSRAIVAQTPLDAIATGQARRHDYNLRWILAHMIEETARHVGQADILRELIDGKTGAGYDYSPT